MKKNPLTIKIYPYDESLRQKSKDVKKITEKELKLFNDMIEIMKKHQGIGLAAPQIGININLIVIDIGEGLVKLANPKITEKSKEEEYMEEGCLSVNDLTVNVRRPKEVVVLALNEKNKKIKIKAVGLLARALQHEIDHLNGKLIVDYDI